MTVGWLFWFTGLLTKQKTLPHLHTHNYTLTAPSAGM